MAGPTASIVCPESFDRLTFRDALNDVVCVWRETDFCSITDTTNIGGRYRGEARPFVGGVRDLLTAKDTSCFSDGKILAIEARFGVTCRSEIELAAMCNGDCDHQILAEVVASLAERFKGVVAFGGLLPLGNILPFGLHVISWIDAPNFIGKSDYSEHCATADAVRWWLSQPIFRMVQ